MMRPLLPLIFLLLLPLATATVYHDYYGAYGGDEWTDWEDAFVNDPYTVVRLPPPRTFGGCYIAGPSSELFDDLDCDKVPDAMDNCLGIPNPAQRDQNQNGLGDACDIVAEYIDLNPSTVKDGTPVEVVAGFSNYKPFAVNNLALTIQIPELGLEEKQYVEGIAAGQSGNYQFYFRVPECAPAKKYDVVLMVEVPKTPGVKEFFHTTEKLEVTDSGNCHEPEEAEQELSDSVITILELQDIDENGGLYPFTIVNDEREAQAYVFTVQGMDDWGEWQIEPRSLIIVPAGESRKGHFVVYSKPGATGTHNFLLTVRSKSDAQQVHMTARIKDELPEIKESENFMMFGILIVGVIIILLALATLAPKRKER